MEGLVAALQRLDKVDGQCEHLFSSLEQSLDKMNEPWAQPFAEVRRQFPWLLAFQFCGPSWPAWWARRSRQGIRRLRTPGAPDGELGPEGGAAAPSSTLW